MFQREIVCQIRKESSAAGCRGGTLLVFSCMGFVQFFTDECKNVIIWAEQAKGIENHGTE